MDYSKFYTPYDVASYLIRQLNITAPSKVIDICCGSCNLLRAAKSRWESTTLFGVDIEMHCSDDIVFSKNDGRYYATNTCDKYPLVLANPPFGVVSAKNEYPDLFSGSLSGYCTSRLEIEMLYANLRVLEDGGTLLIIMPSTFVTASRYKRVRAHLAGQYHIRKIIFLPEDTFGSANISCCALIIEDKLLIHNYTKQQRIERNNEGFSISENCIIPQTRIRAGEWGEIPCTHKSAMSIRRGNISSQDFSANGVPVLHTSKKAVSWRPSMRFTNAEKASNVYAEDNDIIVSRIGKSAGQWCVYSGDKVLISDCLMVIKDPNGEIAKKLGNNQYPYSPKGVATKYITVSDFCTWVDSL